MCLAYAGSGTFTVEGEVHEIVSHPEAGLGIAFWGFALDTTALPEGPGWWDGLLRRERPLVSPRLGSLPAIVSALAAEAASPRSGVDAQVRALGSALVIETGRAFASPAELTVTVDPGARATSAVAAMRGYLADNLARPIRVEDVAAVAHLSDRHAARLFGQETGTPMIAELRRLRLEHAARLLESERPVAQVARECSYPESRPFITAFRALGGTLHL
ncbi:AraC family transcriptional regulator [Brachybacterium rhamnosum]|uniref:Helix-turn-helix transcriptional regulator n=1 Tax=Brachybacterium rhamnosum TaxID=173361 RepID=A0ABW4PYL9_9MICO